MTDVTEQRLLQRAAGRLQSVPGFMAYEMALWERLTGRVVEVELEIPPAEMIRLALCGRPRPDLFGADILTMAEAAHIEPKRLANLLRTVDALTALASQPAVGVTVANPTMFAAARDVADEHSVFDTPPAGAPITPRWLQAAIDRFWGETRRPSRYPVNLDLHILLTLPVALVEIQELRVHSLVEWLASHRLPPVADLTDRRLRGCLLAYAGIGIIFVDAADTPAERRVTLAHETGHFLLDYLLPREQVAKRRPELLDVLDGDRSPTQAEQLDALLADVPIGMHTHVLERDRHGGLKSVDAEQIEERAEQLALELLAPAADVLTMVDTPADPTQFRTILEASFGLPATVAARHAAQLAQLVPGPAQTLLEALGLTDPRTSGTDKDMDGSGDAGNGGLV